MAFNSLPKTVAKQRPIHESCDSPETTSQGWAPASTDVRNETSSLQEHSRNDRLAGGTKDLREVLVHAKPPLIERSTKNGETIDEQALHHDALPTMPPLPSSQCRSECRCHSHPLATTTKRFEHVWKSDGPLGEVTKVAKFPFGRLGLLPPPKLASVLQVTPASKLLNNRQTAKASKKRKEGCENSIATLDPTLCITRCYLTNETFSKRTRTIKALEGRPDETKRVIEAAVVLSSISHHLVVPAVKGPKQQTPVALLAPPSLNSSWGL